MIDDAEVWTLEEAIPPGSAAAIALIEHRWAIPFRDAVVRAGGVALADEWIHAADLVAAAGAQGRGRLRTRAGRALGARPASFAFACKRQYALRRWPPP